MFEQVRNVGSSLCHFIFKWHQTNVCFYRKIGDLRSGIHSQGISERKYISGFNIVLKVIFCIRGVDLCCDNGNNSRKNSSCIQLLKNGRIRSTVGIHCLVTLFDVEGKIFIDFGNQAATDLQLLSQGWTQPPIRTHIIYIILRSYFRAEVEMDNCVWLQRNINDIFYNSQLSLSVLLKRNDKVCICGILDPRINHVDSKHEFSFRTGSQGSRGRVCLMLDVEGSSDCGLIDDIQTRINQQYNEYSYYQEGTEPPRRRLILWLSLVPKKLLGSKKITFCQCRMDILDGFDQLL